MSGAKATSKSVSMHRTQGTRTPRGNMSGGNLRSSCSGPALDPIARTGVRSSCGLQSMPSWRMASSALHQKMNQLITKPFTEAFSDCQATPKQACACLEPSMRCLAGVWHPPLSARVCVLQVLIIRTCIISKVCLTAASLLARSHHHAQLGVAGLAMTTKSGLAKSSLKSTFLPFSFLDRSGASCLPSALPDLAQVHA